MADKQNGKNSPATIAYRVGVVEDRVDDVELDIKGVKENYVKKSDGKFIRNMGVLIVTTIITVFVTMFIKFVLDGGLK